jgi:PPM family protein phosphatase
VNQLTWSAHTEAGKHRSNNEDAFLGLTVDAQQVRYLGKVGSASLAQQDLIFAVSDGMGGEHSGEFASKFATERITRLLPSFFKQGAIGLQRGFSDILIELFQRIHQDLQHLGQSYKECRKMGATLTLTWFTPDWVYLCHVGDSRLYRLDTAGQLHQLTEDHTHVGHLYRTGKINERQLRQHPRRNILNQSLGAGQQFLEPQVAKIELVPGERLLLCSDGITNGLWTHALRDALQSHISAVELVKLALAEGSTDNCTAVLIDVAAPL